MTTEDILKKLNEIFKEVLDNPEINITEETTANDISEWDSLSNIYLIVNIEKDFEIKFLTSELQNQQNIGDLIRDIQTKLS